MLISLNWIRDYVDLPADLDPRDLAERFTRTTAEVDEISPINVSAKGLVVARVTDVKPLPGTRNLHLASLNVGRRAAVRTVTAAPAIRPNTNVVYAPPGASVAKLGEIRPSTVADHKSTGMILPGDALGIAMATQEAVVLSNALKPGESLSAELYDDWVMDIDNKSITHRPDLWGHYGIARELAAIYGLPLKPYPVVDIEELMPGGLPEVPISIADVNACRRYSGLVLEGVPTQPAPLWMQLRLGHVGMRPITGLVDLTNYVMADLGQPMHAFDAATVDRIEVDWAREGERFTTLDGMERTLSASDLMIQSKGHSVALAGVMGGLETEVTPQTTSLLLESANFDPATIRRTAARLSLRTDASARFEKSLDPGYTVLGIQRFIRLARAMYPDMKLAGRLSDGYPTRQDAITVKVDPHHVSRTIGRKVPVDEVRRLLEPLGFGVQEKSHRLSVSVPSYRATNDVGIEADVVEEIARFIGYNNIPPTMPRVTIRQFEPNALHDLERGTLEYFTSAQAFHEIHGYLWYDSEWLEQLGFDPGICVELRNPSADGLHRLRRSLMPGLLAAVTRNRYHLSAFSLIELGSVFDPAAAGDRELRRAGLVCARRGKGAEDELFHRLKGTIEGWVWQQFSRAARFELTESQPDLPWQHPQRTADIFMEDCAVGTVSVVPLALRRMMDEHLGAWGVAWATLRLSEVVDLDHRVEPLEAIPPYPLVEMDFSILVPRSARFGQTVDRLQQFRHPLLKRMQYVTSYEGEAVPRDTRSLTFRVLVGDDSRTLVEEDAVAFRRDFAAHVSASGYRLRA